MIIVHFERRPVRDEFLSKCKSKRPTTGAVFNDGTNGQVYHNEHMTGYYRKLSNDARFKTTEDGRKYYKYVWFKNGKLLVRKGDNTQTTRVLSNKDI